MSLTDWMVTDSNNALAPTCRSTTGLQQHALDTLDPGPALAVGP